jgi:hypothetical protein
MDAQLKAEYAKQLEINAPNWVTGVSSPWVESYAITKTESPGEDSRIIQLIFSTVTSTGPAGDYTATLVLARDGCFWRITQITADDGLYHILYLIRKGCWNGRKFNLRPFQFQCTFVFVYLSAFSTALRCALQVSVAPLIA